jgi:threonine synthase
MPSATFFRSLRCLRCSTSYDVQDIGSCPRCAPGGAWSSLDETLLATYDLEAAKEALRRREDVASRPPGLWRYHELLPVTERRCQVDLGAGGTRLLRLGRIESQLGDLCVYAKDEGANPTGSSKDRPIGVAAGKALERGAEALACMTSGNIGSALAAVAAKAGVPCYVFLLAAAGLSGSEAGVNIDKFVQMRAYGAHILSPNGSFEELLELSAQAERKLGWTFVHRYQPYQVEGDKTAAFEICEQLGWQAPDWIVVPVGAGNICAGLWKGFREFHQLGWIERLPRLLAVQPVGADPLVQGLAKGERVMSPLPAVRPNLALPISHRVSGHHAYLAVQESGGTGISVTDEELMEAVKDLGRSEGIYAEAAGSASLAGLRKAWQSGLIAPGATIVCYLSSHGLKNGAAMRAWFGALPQIGASFDDLLAQLRNGDLRG